MKFKKKKKHEGRGKFDIKEIRRIFRKILRKGRVKKNRNLFSIEEELPTLAPLL